jgi:hypothetical protein
MRTTRYLALPMLAMLLWASLPVGPALAQANCEWYARTALEQQRRNLDRKCGFTGSSWSSDRAAHLAWCKSASPDDWKHQAQLREQQLAKCPAR